MNLSAVKTQDPVIFEAIEAELSRQRSTVELIASENIVSPAVMQAMGTVLTNKYAEGLPHKRFYGGCEKVDIAEDVCRDRVCELFDAHFANVQPHSGAQANFAAYNALVKPGARILGMDLSNGGHLTHGSPANFSGKLFEAHCYELNDEERIDYDNVLAQAHEVKPEVIVAGASAYPREIDFARFREIADEVGAYLMVDMAHIAGIVAARRHISPLPYADVVTSTTHKTLRGPRGGIILSNKEELFKKIDSAVFPGAQGGPLMHVIAAKAVAFGEALKPDFIDYIDRVLENAKAMGEGLAAGGLRLISGGTDNHLLLVDLTATGVSGKEAEGLAESIGLTINKNTIPKETRSPFVASGIRVGSPAMTTRGFTAEESRRIGEILAERMFNPEDETRATRLKAEVDEMLAAHPLYPDFEI